MTAAFRQRLRLAGWAVAIVAAALGPAWLMPPQRLASEEQPERVLPQLADPDAVTEAGEYRPQTQHVAAAVPRPASPRPALSGSSQRPPATRPVANRTPPNRTVSAPVAPGSSLVTPTAPRPKRAESQSAPAPPVSPLLTRLADLSRQYWAEPNARPRTAAELEPLSRRVFFEADEHVLPPQTLRSGEHLVDLAARFDLSWRYLERLNDVDARRLPAGKPLKVVRGPFAVIVEKSRFRATVHARGYVVASYPVAIGRENRTPAGVFRVREKVTNPMWNGPERTVAADDPSNPLGEHWIGLVADGSTPPFSGLGLHGTINPASIGTAASNGCVRLHPGDVTELFDLLVVGSRVEIRE